MSDSFFQESTPVPGRRHEIRDGLRVGRSNTDIVLVDPQVSREHLRLRVDAAGVSVEDLGSRNGTFVNEVRTDAPTLLREGDTLRMGDTVWRYFGAEVAAAAEASRSGDVPAPDPSPSGVRAVVLPDAARAPSFDEPAHPARRGRGSAARNTAATIYSYAVVICTTVAVAVYLAAR